MKRWRHKQHFVYSVYCSIRESWHAMTWP